MHMLEEATTATAVEPEELAVLVDDPNRAPFILDVRAPDQFERWRIEGRIIPPTLNVPYWRAIVEDEEVKAELPTDREIVVVCAHGDSSELVSHTLGLPNLANLAGGMDAWATTLVARPLLDDGRRFVVQLDRIAKACWSYAVGERGAEMVVVDPAADVDRYLAISEDMAAPITHVFDTHLHADHVSVARELAARTGAAYHIDPGDAEGAA